MAFGLNLRADLAKLGDDELAERLRTTLARYDSVEKRWGWFRMPCFSFRGPLRHPRAYRFLLGMQGMQSGHWIEWLFPLVLSSKLTDSLMVHVAESDPRMLMCEIKDLTDEAKRRVESRKGESG